MKDCKENVWTFIRRVLENKNKQGDKGHITRGRYGEIYKSPLTEMNGHVERMQNIECQTHGNSYNGRNKEKRKTT